MQKYRHCLKAILVLSLAALLLGGCATWGSIDPKDESCSLVFGYIDMKDAPSDLDWVSIKQYGDKPYYYHAATEDSLFFHIGMEPGSYQVDQFGGAGGIPYVRRVFTSTFYKYNFGSRGRNDTAIRIAKPGIYYMGAYKFIKHDGGLFKADKFEMEPLKTPTEKDILQKLIHVLESDRELRAYTRQIHLAKARLSALP